MWHALRPDAPDRRPVPDGLLDVDRGRGPGALPARVFSIAARVAGVVRAARAADACPVVLAGDCNSCVGTVAGCADGAIGAVWLDAHPDFDTPEDSASGSLDAMALALLTGRGWGGLRATVPGLASIGEERVALLGVRDLEPGQSERLARSRVRVVAGGGWSDARAAQALDNLRGRVDRVYLHIDLDMLDPSEGIANRYSAEAA